MNMTQTIEAAQRYHDISCGHRVVGHENKCQHLHGHNYRIWFHLVAEEGLDKVGRVIDFGVIKKWLCQFLEDQWDHKMLIWAEDPWLVSLKNLDPVGVEIVPFNPTAENMAKFLLTEVAPHFLKNTGAILTKVTVEETRKCSAISKLK